jgi:hypothetical protein
MYLHFGFTPPQIIRDAPFAFIPSVYMFEKIELIAGNTVIETLYPEFMNIYFNIFNDFTKKKGIIRNVGPLHNNRDTEARLPDNSDRILDTTNRTYTLPLPFYFSQEMYQCFPLCALWRQELVVRFYMRPKEYIVQLGPDIIGFPTGYKESLESVQFTHCYMDIEYIYLGNDEFTFFSEKEHVIYYTETQYQTHQLVKTDVHYNRVHLRTQSPVVEFFLWVLPDTEIEKNRVDKHDLYNPRKHTIDRISLQLDGNDFITDDVADSNFLNQLQPYIHHSSTFEHNTYTNNSFVYMYSFSDNPEKTFPTGTVNFNMYKNKILNVYIPEEITSLVDKTLFIHTRTLQILNIKDGVAETLFKNVL